MRKVSMVFLSLIILATLVLGLLWGQTKLLAAAQASLGNIVLMVIYSLILIAALLCLVRILVRLAPASSAGKPGDR